VEPPYDHAGRDPMRHPMQWEATPTAGFTSGQPWLPPVDPEKRSVEAQRADPDSLLHFYRRLIELRRSLGDDFRLLDSAPGLVSFERGGRVIAINTTAEPRPAPPLGELVLESEPNPLEAGRIAPHAGAVTRRAE
jgi:glycosidase